MTDYSIDIDSNVASSSFNPLNATCPGPRMSFTSSHSSRSTTGHPVTRNDPKDNTKKFSYRNFVSLCRIIYLSHWRLGYHNIYYGLLLVATLSIEVVSISIMDIISSFYSAIIDLSKAEFYHVLYHSMLIIGLIAFLKTVQMILTDLCNIINRKYLTMELNSIFLSYPIELKDIYDNLDQRLCQDIELFTTKYTTLVTNLIIIPFIIIYYTISLVNIFGIMVPVVCYAYFIVGSIITGTLMRNLVPLVYQYEIYQGNYRHGYMLLLQHIESILMWKGIRKEMSKLGLLFDCIFNNQLSVLMYNFPLYLCSNLFAYFGSIVNYAVIGIAILYSLNSNGDGADIASLISGGSYACLYLISSFTTIIESFEMLSQCLALAMRLDEIYTYPPKKGPTDRPQRHFNPRQLTGNVYSSLLVTENKDTMPANDIIDGNLSVVYHGRAATDILLDIRNVDVFCRRSANNNMEQSYRVLVKSLSLSIKKGMRIVVTGPSGCGKSSFMQLLAEITGYLTSDHDEEGQNSSIDFFLDRQEVSFVSQLSYCYQGGIIDNIIYPMESEFLNSRINLNDNFKFLSSCLQAKNKTEVANDINLDSIRDSLRKATLTEFVDTVSEESNNLDPSWLSKLSAGMKQKLLFARLFYHKPQLAFLDEITSSLDEESEKQLYTELIASGCDTFVSVGHRHSLRSLHTHELHFDSKNGYSFRELF